MRKRPLSERISELAEGYAEERKAQDGLGDIEFAGAGGEQAVFYVKQKEGKEGEHRNLVMKADMHFLREGIRRYALIQHDKLQPDMQKMAMTVEERTVEEAEARQIMKEMIEREKDFFQHLERYFPKETILKHRSVVREVPVTPGLAKEILEADGLDTATPDHPIDVATLLRYQHPIPEAAKSAKEGKANPEAHSFGFRYAERYNIPLDEYVRLNQSTRSTEGEVDEELFFKFLHVGTKKLLTEAQSDQELHQVLEEFIRRTISFTNETQEMMDIAGGGNVRVYRNEEGKWTYLFVDPYAGNEWTGAREAAQKVSSSGRIDRRSANDLLNAVNYERTINGIAKILGIQERVSLASVEDSDATTLAQNYLVELRSRNGWPDRFVFKEPPLAGDATVPVPKKKYEDMDTPE